MELVKCDHCDGKGGTKDYWGEWSECPCCNEVGHVTPKRLREYNEELAAMDAEYERLAVAEGLITK